MAASPFLEALSRHVFAHHYGKRTVKSYLYWIRYHIRFQRKRHPQELGTDEVQEFLSFLANDRQLSVTTQKIALNALAFLYNKYLNKPLGDLGAFNKATRQRKLPVVLTRAEVAALLSKIHDSTWLLAAMIYGSGLRRIEAVRLRVNSIDFDHGLVRVWAGKGGKNRVVTIPPELFPHLRNQIAKVQQFLREDSTKTGFCGVWLPNGLARKYPNASHSLNWQYLFPSSCLSHEPGTGNLRRHHVDESTINNQEPIYAPCRSNWGTATSRRLRSTRMCSSVVQRAYAVPSAISAADSSARDHIKQAIAHLLRFRTGRYS